MPGFSFSSTLDLDISTVDGDEHVIVSGEDVGVTIAGQVITFSTFHVARTTTDGVTQTRIHVEDGHFAITGDGADLLDVAEAFGDPLGVPEVQLRLVVALLEVAGLRAHSGRCASRCR